MYQKQELQNKPGLTIVELLIAMAIFAMVGLILSSILITQNRSFKEHLVRNKLVTDTIVIFSQIRNFSFHAESILATYTYDAIEYTTDSDTVILEIPSIDSSGDLVVGEVDTVVLNMSSNSMQIIVDPGAGSAENERNATLLLTVKDLIIRYNNEDETLADQFSFTLELEEEYFESRTQQSIQTATFTIRNAE